MGLLRTIIDAFSPVRIGFQAERRECHRRAWTPPAGGHTRDLAAKGILVLFCFKLLVPRLTVPELDIFET
jgi:hypothetical protein